MAIALVNHVAAQGYGYTGADTSSTPGPVSMIGASVIEIGTSGYFGAPAPSDSSGNTYTQITLQSDSTTPLYSATWQCENPTVTGSMTFSTSGSDYYETLDVTGLSGTLTSGALDASHSAQIASDVTLQPGSVPVVSGEATITFLAGTWFSGTATIDSGFSITDQSPHAAGHFGAAMAYNLAAASPTNPTWSGVTPAGALQAHIATFKPAGGGGGGTSYYVATTGNDANPGTIGSPFLTIGHGVSVVNPGDSLWIRGGTYTGSGNLIVSVFGATHPAGTSGSPITIGAYAPGGASQPAGEWYGPAPNCEVVIIQPPAGTTSAVEWLASANQYLTIQDIIFDGSLNTTDTGSATVYLSGGASHNIFRRCEIKNSINFGCGASTNNGSANFNQFLNCDVHSNGDPSGAATNGHGLYLGTTDNTISGCRVHDNQGEGIQINASDGLSTTTSRTTITRNRVYNNGARAASSAANITVSNGDSQFIANNLVYSDGRSNLLGIQIYSYSTNALVYNNTVYGHGWDGILLQYYSSNPILTNNIVYNNAFNINDMGGFSGSPVLTTNLLTNPFFNNVSLADFHLTPSSINAINAGTTLAAVPTDFDGLSRPQGTAYCIGAYEFPSGGTTYYVDIGSIGGSASDGNNGTSPATPWLTLAHAAATALAGSTILIRRGLYTGSGQTIDTALGTVNSGTAGNPITWSAYPGNLPPSVTPGPRPGAEVVIIQPSGSHCIGLTLPAGTAPSYLIFEDLVCDMIHQPNTGGAVGVYLSGGASNNQFIHLEIKNNGDTGLGFSSSNGNSPYNQVLYNLIHDNGLDQSLGNSGYGMYISSSDNLVQGNDVYSNHGYGINFNVLSEFDSSVNNNLIVGNRVHNNWCWVASGGSGGESGGGISIEAQGGVGEGNNIRIYDNLVYNNGYNLSTGLVVTGTTASGIQIYADVSGALAYNNTIYGNNGDGISCQYYDEAVPPIVRNNISWNNAGTQIIDYGGLNGHTVATIDHYVTTNPSVVNATGAPPDFHLTAGSAIAIGQGLHIPAITTDFDGNVFLNPPSIGAYEFGTGPPPSPPFVAIVFDPIGRLRAYPADLRTSTLNLLTTVLAPRPAPTGPFDLSWLPSGRPPYPVDLRTAAINLLLTTLVVPAPPLRPIDSGLILPRPAYPSDLRTAVADLLQSTLRDRPFIQRDLGMLLTRPYALDLRTAILDLLATTLMPGPPPWVVHLDALAPLRPAYPNDLRTAVLNLVVTTLKPPPIPVPHGQVLVWPATPYRWQTWG